MENIELETVRGDDDGWVFEAFDDDDNKADLTNCRFDMWIKPNSKGETIKLSTETGEIEVQGNLIIVVLSHDKTKGVAWSEASWDLQVTDGLGLIQTIAGAGFTLTHDITEA